MIPLFVPWKEDTRPSLASALPSLMGETGAGGAGGGGGGVCFCGSCG